MGKIILIILIVAGIGFYMSTSSEVGEVAKKLLPICKGDSKCEDAVIDHAEVCNEEFWMPMFNEHARMLKEYGSSPEFEQKYGAYSREYSKNLSIELTKCITRKSGYEF